MLDISHLRLPRTLSNWPWPRQINRHYDEVKTETTAWFHGFKAFTPDAQTAFDLCDFCLLASLAYPKLDKARLRTGCDLMMMFFVFDEYTDNQSAAVVRSHANIVMDAIRHPHKTRPSPENILGEIARQFWALAIKTASVTSQRRFVDVFTAYTDAVVEQAVDRDCGRVRNIGAYMTLRRSTIGAKPSFVPMELAMDLPDYAIQDPQMALLSGWVTDMIILGNDICSYNKEQSMGDDLHNIISIIKNQHDTDIEGALEWVAAYHQDLVSKFLTNWNNLPSWGKVVDLQVAEYVQGLANWVRANDAWTFESGRYFGKDGLEIQKHRVVTLLPKMTS